MDELSRALSEQKRASLVDMLLNNPVTDFATGYLGGMPGEKGSPAYQTGTSAGWGSMITPNPFDDALALGARVPGALAHSLRVLTKPFSSVTNS